MSCSGLSFRNGIIGSMRTDVGMSFAISVSTVFKRVEGGGACGSMVFAISSLSVVMVKEIVERIFFRRSMSLVTRLDLVIT